MILSRRCAHIVTIAVAVALSTMSCRRDGPQSTVFGSVRDSMPEASTAVSAIGELTTSCSLVPLDTLSLRVPASVMPLGFRDNATPTDSLWSPNVITDIAVSHGDLFVLDGVQQRVTRFDDRLNLLQAFGRAGEGPGEFQHAAALMADTSGHLFVADPGTSRLTELSGDMRLINAKRFPSVSGMLAAAMTTDGAIWVTKYVIPETLTRGRGNGVALGRIPAGDSVLQPVLDLATQADAASRILRLPGPNEIRVVATDDYVLLVVPAVGVVDIYRQGQVVGTASACLPSELDAAYTAQLEAYTHGRGSRSQQWQPIVTDAMVHGDTLYLVGPLPDAHNNFHVDMFTLSGKPIGSIVASFGNEHITRNVRFWGTPNRLISFGTQGTLLRVDLTDGGWM